MADSTIEARARKSARMVNDSNSHGRSASLPVNKFKYMLPSDGSCAPEAVGLCLAAVPSAAVTADWAQVTCKNCLRLEGNRARQSRDGTVDANRSKSANATLVNSSPESPSRAIGQVPHESEPISGHSVLTLEEAAGVLRCSKSHFINLVHGRVLGVPPLPHLSVGRRIVIRRESLERWLAAVETHGDRTA